MTMRVLYHGARVLLGVVFIYASIHKILYPGAFAGAVFNYQILPAVFINLTALILPWLELVIGILLLLNVWMPGTVVIVNGLLLTFTSALIFNLARGLDIACGCFTTRSTENEMTLLTLLRDSSFLLVSLFLLYWIFLRRDEDTLITVQDKGVRKLP
ncbi:MAG TPA: DoxX family membrane protein [Deltaproteobacteria bacterium]|nr:DoxX family membrane protein [Deltaproteobacteria bacterium]